MKAQITLLLLIMLTACNVQTKKTTEDMATSEFFIGTWALDLNYDNNNVGWLEVRQEDGYLDADLLWRWGSVLPAEFVFMNQGHLIVSQGQDIVRTKDTEGIPVRVQHAISWLQIKKNGDNEIMGVALFPNKNGVEMEEIAFVGRRNPVPGPKPDPDNIEFGEPIQLLSTSDLSGWSLLNNAGTNGWSLVDGVLINDPVQKEGEAHISYGNLRTDAVFEDFNLTLEVNVPEGSNSGVYLRGLYEIQVLDSYGKELDSHNMGALYSRITPSVAAEKPANEWQDLDITLYHGYLTVKLNGTIIIDNQLVKGVTGGAMSSDESKAGPIYLQGDHGKVAYRNIVIKKILN